MKKYCYYKCILCKIWDILIPTYVLLFIWISSLTGHPMFYLAILSFLSSLYPFCEYILSILPHIHLLKKNAFLLFNKYSRSGKNIELGEKEQTRTTFNRTFNWSHWQRVERNISLSVLKYWKCSDCSYFSRFK